MSKLPAKSVEPLPAFFSPDQVDLIKRQICPGATDDELKMFLWDCQRSRLDPFARQIYSIERNEKFLDDKTQQWRWRKKRVTQISIDGFRLIAERTGDYAGQLGPQWCGTDGAWRDVWTDTEPPAAARVAALRKDFEQPLWTPAAFAEYAVKNDKGEPTGQWRKMPAVMIAKCAEALALRRAFPRDLSGFYTDDEMAQAGNPVSPGLSPAQKMQDQIQDQIPDHAERSTPNQDASASAAAAPTPSPLEPAAATISLEDMAREAAMRGRDQLVKFFNSRNSKEKQQLRKIERDLVELYPTEGSE